MPPRLKAGLVGVGADDVAGRTDMHLPGVGVDNDRIALVDPLHNAARVANRGDAESFGDDGNVALPTRFLDDETTQPRAIIVEQIGGPHAARHQNSVVWQLGGDGVSPGPAGQDAQQAVRQFVEVAESFVPIGLGLAQHAHPRVVLHAFDGGFRRHPSLDGVFHAPKPAAVVREHAVGLKNITMLAGGRQLALIEHLVDRRLEVCHGDVEASSSSLGSLASSSVTTTRNSCKAA